MDFFSLFTDLLSHIEDERANYFFPKEADLNGAAVALVRLQDLFGMNMKSIAKGVIKKKHTHGNKGNDQTCSLIQVAVYLIDSQSVFKDTLTMLIGESVLTRNSSFTS
mgnify:CR=1 FL=1